MIKLPPDITFVIQVLSFLIFWQIMKRLLFAPVQRALEARAARTNGERARAETLQAEARARAAEVNAVLDEVRRQGVRQAEELRGRSEEQERVLLERSRADVLALLERERAVTRSQVEAARVPLRAEAERLADQVVAKVLGHTA
jgi:F0F1-type ATP synthase membrane subunit b/b'